MRWGSPRTPRSRATSRSGRGPRPSRSRGSSSTCRSPGPPPCSGSPGRARVPAVARRSPGWAACAPRRLRRAGGRLVGARRRGGPRARRRRGPAGRARRLGPVNPAVGPGRVAARRGVPTDLGTSTPEPRRVRRLNLAVVAVLALAIVALQPLWRGGDPMTGSTGLLRDAPGGVGSALARRAGPEDRVVVAPAVGLVDRVGGARGAGDGGLTSGGRPRRPRGPITRRSSAVGRSRSRRWIGCGRPSSWSTRSRSPPLT